MSWVTFDMNSVIVEGIDRVQRVGLEGSGAIRFE